MILYNQDGNILASKLSNVSPARAEIKMNNDQTTSSSTLASADTNNITSSSDNIHHAVNDGSGVDNMNTMGTRTTTTTLMNTQSHIVATSAALDAAEEFIQKMDDAFAELDDEQIDDGHDDDDIREDAESYPDFDNFENDSDFDHNHLIRNENGSDDGYRNDDNGDPANNKLIMKSISNAIDDIAKHNSHERDYDYDYTQNDDDDDLNGGTIGNMHNSTHHSHYNNGNNSSGSSRPPYLLHKCDDDGTNSTQPCLSSSSSYTTSSASPPHHRCCEEEQEPVVEGAPMPVDSVEEEEEGEGEEEHVIVEEVEDLYEDYEEDMDAAHTTFMIHNLHHHNHHQNRSVLDIVQEEPEEEEAAKEEEEEEDCMKQQEYDQQEAKNTNWDDDNGFFDFTDEEGVDDGSSIESPLLSPMAVGTTATATTAATAATAASYETRNNDNVKNDPEGLRLLSPPPPPQDQPDHQQQQLPSNGDLIGSGIECGIHYENGEDDEEGNDGNDGIELITTESTETGITNILHASSIDTIPSSNRSSTNISQAESSTISPNATTATPINDTNMASPPPPTPSSSSSSPPPCAKTLTYMYIDQKRTDQLAQSHAEDVLSLTLELQTLRAQLTKEEQEHSKTKQYLEKEETKSVEIEMLLQQLKIDMDTMKKEHDEELCTLQEDAESYKLKMEEAEEDAQQALVIAKESDMKVKEMEEYLQKALDEVEQLRASAATTTLLPMISEQEYYDNINNEDDNLSLNYETPQRSSRRSLLPTISSCSPSRRDRAVITMGRSILRQVENADDMSTTSNNSSTYEGSTTSTSSYLATLTRRSAEKRQKLRDCMNRSSIANDTVDPTGKEVVCFSSPHSNNGLDLGYGSAFISTIKAVSKTMKQSGKRLNLGGRWFHGANSSAIKKKKQSDADDLDLESLTRNYCTSVEALVSKQREEVKELKQFCGFLEENLRYK